MECNKLLKKKIETFISFLILENVVEFDWKPIYICNYLFKNISFLASCNRFIVSKDTAQ